MFNHLLLCGLVLMPVACASVPPVLPPPTLPLPPAEAALPCPPIPAMFTNSGEALVWVDAVTNSYVLCEAKRRLLVESWPK